MIIWFVKIRVVYLTGENSVVYTRYLRFAIKNSNTSRDWFICLAVFIIYKCPAHDNSIYHTGELYINVFVHLDYQKMIITNKFFVTNQAPTFFI
jgi:hypothetical protein